MFPLLMFTLFIDKLEFESNTELCTRPAQRQLGTAKSCPAVIVSVHAQ
jgi:hypothetical protein